MKTKLIALVVVAASAAFGGVLDSAWIQGKTDKCPLSYKPGEKMVFTLTPQGLDGAVPEGEFFLQWTRSGDDGIRESGKVPLDGKPFVYETKIDKPGFVRLQADVVDKDGKQFIRKFTGDATTPSSPVRRQSRKHSPSGTCPSTPSNDRVNTIFSPTL